MTRRYDVLAVIKSRITIDGDCWLFAGTDNGHGYQAVAGDYAHRHAHRLCIGPIPDGYEVDHLCFRPACVNPAHLEAVTPEENKRRAFAAQTQCKHGHDLPPFVGERRECRECHRRRQAERTQRIRDGVTPPTVVKPEQHGTLTGYSYGCRCDPCRAAQAVRNEIPNSRARAARAHARALRGPKAPTPIQHGTHYGYCRGCRCDECRAANTEVARIGRARRRARASAA